MLTSTFIHTILKYYILYEEGFMLKNIKISHKLYFSAFISFIFIIAIGSCAIFILNSLIQKTLPLERALHNTKEYQLSAENDMRKFISKDIINEEFFKTQKSANFDNFSEEIQLSIDNLNTLKKSPIISSNEENVLEIEKLIDIFSNYQALANEKFNLVYKRGFYTYGLMGKLKLITNELESGNIVKDNKDLKILLLQLRRGEKDYFLRQQEKYFDKTIKYSNEMIEIVSSIDNSEAASYIRSLNEYNRSFNEIFHLDKRNLENSAQTSELLSKIPASRDHLFELVFSIIESRNKNAKIFISAFAIIAVILSLFLQTYIARLITKPIYAVTEILESTANFDLTVNNSYNKYFSQKNEIGTMAMALSTMRNELKAMALTIKKSSNSVNNHSQDLAGSSDEISNSAKGISVAMVDISKNNEYSANELHYISEAIQEFDAALEQMIIKINDIESASVDMQKTADSSNDKMLAIKSSVESINSMFVSFARNIQQLVGDIKTISSITDTLNDLSDQTTLLALNASIEAARAGEHGRGFSIVADEVRKLAEKSKESSDKINQLIANITTDAEQIIDGTNQVNSELNKQSKGITLGIESFRNIIGNIASTMNEIQYLSGLTKSLGEEKNSIVNKISSISEFSKTNSASSQEISASSEELKFSMEKIYLTAKDLNSMTNDMLDHANKFKL